MTDIEHKSVLVCNLVILLLLVCGLVFFAVKENLSSSSSTTPPTTPPPPAPSTLPPTGPAARPSITQIISFGDSLSSTSNGRWTDGLTWVEYLSANLSVPLWNFATPGAVSEDLLRQVAQFQSSAVAVSLFHGNNASVPSSSRLFSIWIGSNDFLQEIEKKNFSHLELVCDVVMRNIQRELNELSKWDVSAEFLLLTLPPLHLSPALASLPQVVSSLVEAVILKHNQNVRRFAASFDKVILLDVYPLVASLLKNVTDLKSMFYDNIHPNTRVHYQLAGVVLESLTRIR
eukprot:TRINITY_DN5477_c0_g1_i1.p1 TRINITY_DN5477_c0_g1~~TRINITY_DN5477_c0_g1_i1.p1  ORF type:complete len:298 (-),score=56.79 TRINITY_DN5477_c0_g1_i1:151-1014(-)